MISRVAMRMGSVCMRAGGVRGLVCSGVRAGFSRQISTKSLRQLTEAQLAEELKEKVNLDPYEKKIKDEGWTVTLRDMEIELNSSRDGYNVKVLTVAKAPSEMNNEEEDKQEMEDDQSDLDMLDLTIMVTRTGVSKCMMIQLSADNEGVGQFERVFFTSSLEEAMKLRTTLQETPIYTGPDVGTLFEELADSFDGFIAQQLGVNQTFLQAVQDFSVSYEQQFYVKWLSDLKDFA